VPLQGTPPPDAFVILMPEGDTDEPTATPPPAAASEPTVTPPAPLVEHESEKQTPHIKGEKPGKGASDRPPAESPPGDANGAAASDKPPAETPPAAKPETTPDKPDEPAKSDPQAPKKKDKIDRTDTLDPFGKK
jgi:hypothetical protein